MKAAPAISGGTSETLITDAQGSRVCWLFDSALTLSARRFILSGFSSSREQGYGGGDTAMGGGQTGGDAYTRDADQAAGQQQDASFGGDQTNLDAGANTNYGVSCLFCPVPRAGPCMPDNFDLHMLS